MGGWMLHRLPLEYALDRSKSIANKNYAVKMSKKQKRHQLQVQF